jgi:creatinine amidohydrolase
MDSVSRYWSDLAWTDFPRLDPATVVIVPVSAIEQHGPHLPLSVDAALNHGILARALELAPAELPLLVLPPQEVGLSVEHQRFPGTLTLEPETVLALWTDLGASVARAGLRRILFFNSHGGQTQIMNLVCTRLRMRFRMLAVGASWFRLERALDAADMLPESELRHGIHGGAIETAMMLHLDPGAVRQEAIDDFSSRWLGYKSEFPLVSPEGPVAFGWETQDLHPSGAVGNARLANAELGAAIVEDAAEALLRVLWEMRKLNVDQLLQDNPANFA